MENCRTYTEAKDRNGYLSQIYLSDMCRVRTLADLPHTPCHFHPNPMKTINLRSKNPVRPPETKDLQVPIFASFQKQRTYSETRLTASRSRNPQSQRGQCGPATPRRPYRGTTTLVSI